MFDLAFRVGFRVAFRLFMIGLVLLLAAPAFAQGEGVVPVEDGLLLSWWQVIMGVVSAVLAGGALSLAGIGLIARRIREDGVTLAAVERLGDSVPADVAKMLLDFSLSMKEISLLLHEAVDGIPAASKPPEETRPVEPVG